MYRARLISVVMPAYNVQEHVVAAIRAVPAFVDQVVLVDDASTDDTGRRARALGRRGLVVLHHPRNRGVGGAIATGYAEALRCGADVVAVMAGDGQMDPRDLRGVLDPVVEGRADYVKGNRFARREVWRVMPRARLLGNIVLSLLTRVTSGYWRVFDSQCGYTAISRAALLAIEGRVFSGYGYPNDLLARLRTVGARVRDVPVRPIYDGQPSGIRLRTVLHPILSVLLRSMARRLWLQRLRPLLAGGRARPRRAVAPARHHLLAADDARRSADHLVSAPRP